MSEASPARAYFEACRGRWRTPVAITVTDVAALQRSGMSWLDRLQVRWLGVEITQQTTREANLGTVHQQGPGFQGLQELQRQA